MTDLIMWVVADADGKVYRQWDGDSVLFHSKKSAQEFRANHLLGETYRKYKPKKVKVTDAK